MYKVHLTVRKLITSDAKAICKGNSSGSKKDDGLATICRRMYIFWFLIVLVVLVMEEVDSFSVRKTSTDSHWPAKHALLEELDNLSQLNQPTKSRTALVSQLCQVNPTAQPGATKSFAKMAIGMWSVIYAPHISTIGMGSFDPVLYELRPDQTCRCHARFQTPLSAGWLSVSGTYGSHDEANTTRVDFDKAWICLNQDKRPDIPYPCFESVPDSWQKDAICAIGKRLFMSELSIFPVSYLDEELCVFDFKLLGTRICCRKIDATQWIDYK